MDTAVRFDPHRDRGVGSLDLASAYLRVMGLGVVARYAVAVLPLLAAGWWWIDVVTAEDRAGIGLASVAVLFGLAWRWALLAWVQAYVAGQFGTGTRLTLGVMMVSLLVRVSCFALMMWAGVLILPAILAFYVFSFVSLKLMSTDAIGQGLQRCVGLVWRNLGVLWRHGVVTMLLFLVWLLTLMLVQSMLLALLLPSVMGVDTTDVRLAMTGPAWWLSLGLIGWVGFDLFWSVASVFELDRLESRRTGADLSARLNNLGESTA